MAMFMAVVSLAKKPTIEGAGDFLQSDPAPSLKDSFNLETGLKETLPTFQPPALFPDAGGSQWGAGPPATLRNYRMVEHDPLYAYIYDPGFTIPKPAPPPSAPVQSAGGALSEAEFDSFLQAAGVPVEWWADFKAIAHCESRWNPSAIGDGGNSIGLMQMWYGWRAPAGVTDLMNPLDNLIAAKYVREVRGRFGGGGGWTCADKLGIP